MTNRAWLITLLLPCCCPVWALDMEFGGLPTLDPSLAQEEPISTAHAAFSTWATTLGQPAAESSVWVGSPAAAIEAGVPAALLAPLQVELPTFQRSEAYLLVYIPTAGRVYAVADETMGFAYALSDLQTRLRVVKGKIVLAFPEWEGAGPFSLLEKPAFEGRGEYINIGYNMPPITPHEWEPAQWEQYIDKLVLARINTLYLYLWINAYTTYPGSNLATEPVNQKVHAGMQSAIRHAHRRGLKVIHMICPTFFPKDIWDAHPEMQAEIVYVDHGFPAACPSAPGAWDLMKAIWTHEMETMHGADGVQIWFYDPGGCWCEKNGCRTNQAEILARQVKEFGDIFTKINPGGRVEFNYWPLWLWESEKKIAYRDAMGQGIKGHFPGTFQSMVANGAPDTPVSQPRHEQGLGFRTGVFIFATNPETGYAFVIPNLRYVQAVTTQIQPQHFEHIFGHRLEVLSRYPGTFIMGQFLWNPQTDPASTVRRFTGWQTADPAAGETLARAIHLLEKFTDEGATAELGAEMARLTHEALAQTSVPGAREQLAYFEAMMEALAAIGASAGMEAGAALEAQRGAFVAALRKEPMFNSIDAHHFDAYRENLVRGWAKQAF